MICQQYELDKTVLSTTEALTLWRTERGTVEIAKRALAIPIMLNKQKKGYVLHGDAKLVLDTIIETDKGAIGRPTEKEITDPFLMLGDTTKIEQHLDTASKEDLTEMRYNSDQELIAKAEALLKRFLGKETMHNSKCCSDSNGFVFAFQNNSDKLDVLIAKDSKLVYNSLDKVFVSKENKTILETSDEVILSSNRKSLVIKRQPSCCGNL